MALTSGSVEQAVIAPTESPTWWPLVTSAEAIPPSTVAATIATAVSAMRDGAHDFLVKPFADVAVVLATLDRAYLASVRKNLPSLEHRRL